MTDDGRGVDRRTVLRGVGAGVGAAALAAAAEARRMDSTRSHGYASETDPHTADTLAALVDAVIPETPGLAITSGSEHGPGGLAVGLDEFLVTYMNTLFQVGLPGLGHLGNGRLSELVAQLLNVAASELLGRGLNEHEPGAYAPPGEDWSTGGPFAHLHPEDRIRAIALFDEEEKDFETSELPGPVGEGDAGLIAQLVIAFTELVYYSEWEGYPEGEGLTEAPSERSHPNTQAAVQSWRQTDFPGNAPGYQALRGYASKKDSSLGDDDVWKRIITVDGSTNEDDGTEEHLTPNEDGPTVLRIIADRIPLSDTDDDTTGERRELLITRGPGRFRDNEYDTSDYEEVYPESEDGGSPGGGRDKDIHAQAELEAEHGPVDVEAEVNVTVDGDDVGSGFPGTGG